jgi:chemotaxis protein CheX
VSPAHIVPTAPWLYQVSPLKAEYINPFVTSAVEVFSTMLECRLTRGELSLNPHFQPKHDISGVIGLSGKASGTVVVSVDRNVAISATECMLGQRPASINSDVIDAVGELTNMIAGRAKAGLQHLHMTLALPTVITGQNHVIRFGSAAQTLCIPYTCKWGAISVEVGLVEAEPAADAMCRTLAGTSAR